MKKNFFYRVNPESVLSELTSLDQSEWLSFVMNFLHDLRKDDETTAKTELAAKLIIESKKFRGLRSKAGRASVQQRSTNVNICSTYVQQSSTSSSSSSIKDKNITSDEVSPMEEITDKKFCFDTAKKLNIDASVIGRFLKKEKVLADILTRMLAIDFEDAKGATAYLVSAMKKSANEEQFPVPTTKQPYC